MNDLQIEFENCYGINKLSETFSFKNSLATLIYAPNGVMKTSFAKTFFDLSKKREPEEKMYGKQPSHKITLNGNDLIPDDILVIKPFAKDFESNCETENLSTLLVNPDQKQVYDKLFKAILEAKKSLILELNKVSKIPKIEIEQQISKDLDCPDIFSAIGLLSKNGTIHPEYSTIEYLSLFDPKVVELLKNEEVKVNISEYAEKYKALMEESALFKPGIFNPIKASAVSNALKKEMFFNAGHKVQLNGSVDLIEEHAGLDNLFEKEKEKILGNGSLKNISNKIISGVSSIKTFQEILENHPEIALELSDFKELRKTIWGAYYETNKLLFDNLFNLYETNKKQLAEIQTQANLETTLWFEAHLIFKERFHVPFQMDVENHIDAILGTTKPVIVFTFFNELGKPIKFNRGQLDSLDVLSQGERRAMYLLYVIFEFVVRKKSGKKTLIVIDDIADSFDYKNKYAIIEYLKELTTHPLFLIIVLTHNFDFYRTFQSRVLMSTRWDNSFIAQRNENSIKLLKGGSNDVANPFELWRKKYNSNPSIFISMIPFVRNLIEYKDGESPQYKQLTSLLHIKQHLPDLKISDLAKLIGQVVKELPLDNQFDLNMKVIDFIHSVATKICDIPETDVISLENKIVLSIAARLNAEKYIWSKVHDQTHIDNNQTGMLFDRFLGEENKADENFTTAKKILSEVMLMTPENIHLNSFMYEPLMDLSNLHLINLYKKTKTLH